MARVRFHFTIFTPSRKHEASFLWAPLEAHLLPSRFLPLHAHRSLHQLTHPVLLCIAGGGCVCGTNGTGFSEEIIFIKFSLQLKFLRHLGGSVSSVSSSSHDLAVHEFEPCVRLSAVSVEPTSDPLSSSLHLLHTPSLSLSKINIKKN